MKKLFRKLVAGIMVLGCVFAMIGCAPKLNIDDVEDALKDNDYEVEIIKGDDLEEQESYIKKILSAVSKDNEDDYFYMIEFKDKKTAKMLYEQERVWYEACIMEDEAEIKFYEQVLKEYESVMMTDEIYDIEDEIKELRECIEEDKESLNCIGRNGVCVWIASNEDALKDAQGK